MDLKPPPPQHREKGREILRRFQDGDFAGAETLCRRLIAMRPDDAALHGLMGSIKAARGDHRGALDCFNSALEGGLDDFALHMNRGLAARRLEEWGQAEAAFRHAATLQPAEPGPGLELGNVKRLQGKFHEAIEHYNRTIKQAPQFAEAHAALALVHEQQHDLKAAIHAAESALALSPSNVTAALVHARAALRQGQAATARRQLEVLIAEQPLTAQNRAYALNVLGQACEQCNDYAAAFEYFSKAKEALQSLYNAKAFTGESIYSPGSIHVIQSFFQQHPVSEWPGFTPEQPLQLAFLVGFPRSGTTLLEQILAAHPDIRTIEEQATLTDAMQDLLTSPQAMQRLPALSGKEIQHYRDQYLNRIRDHLSIADGGLIVDKLPLNTVALGLIWRLFPEARIIWAIRDPRAVVLSCFQQNFGPNDAMVNMLSLNSIAHYYSSVMELGAHFQASLPLAQHLLRYEDLVDDIESEIRRLLAFLEVEWDPTVLQYRKSAKQRRINTPSYQQVVKPIYTSSKARWRDYAEHLEPVMPVLKPFVEYYGY